MNDIKENMMLTTIDNPFDPFNQWDQWLRYDINKGYNTLAYLARVTVLADDLTEEEEFIEINQAMDEIIELHKTLYTKVIKK